MWRTSLYPRLDPIVPNCCSHKSLLHFSPQTSHLSMCNYHQELHRGAASPNLTPRAELQIPRSHDANRTTNHQPTNQPAHSPLLPELTHSLAQSPTPLNHALPHPLTHSTTHSITRRNARSQTRREMREAKRHWAGCAKPNTWENARSQTRGGTLSARLMQPCTTVH